MKDSKKVESMVAREPNLESFKYDDFFNNRLTLPTAFKEDLKSQNLDFRFINSIEFRAKGNQHRSHWKPYRVPNPEKYAIEGLNSEGLIQRGDLILAVRDKKISAAHKKFITERNQRYQGHNKAMAQELRKMARDAGVSDHVKIHEGYEENE